MNPHAYVWVDVKDENGKVVTYAFESLSPNAFMRGGWTRNSLKAGDEATVDGYLAKDGKPLADGSIHANSPCLTAARCSLGPQPTQPTPPSSATVKTQSIKYILAVALAWLAANAQDQTGKFGPVGPGATGSLRKDKAPQGPTPKVPDGNPDFSGVWTPNNFFAMGQPSLTPWADPLYKERRANLSKDDPEGHCLPAGVPRISPFPVKLVQASNLVVMLEEGNIHSYRQFFLDGRGHPRDVRPLWMGDSVAKWDADTLVVDTVGFNDKTWLNGQGLPHSDQLHVIERFQRPDLGHLSVDITLDDPKAFTKPHTFHRIYTLLTDWEIHEYVCNEFNVDAEHLVGK